ncbi:MAG TPA: acetyl-coenzyme A synthetase N-terminal domain-containing protein, partial [Hyphomicrobiales bacterium]|nr:acetyl-coenzyme A synthetase N-terminal domain-containing protein [Hyphomicrobiales bacterium]
MSQQKVHRVPRAWAKSAYIDDETYIEMYEESVRSPAKFWRREGKCIDWIKPYKKIKNTSFDYPDVFIKWF